MTPFQDMEVVTDEACPPGTAYLLNPNYMSVLPPEDGDIAGPARPAEADDMRTLRGDLPPADEDEVT